MAQTYPLLTTIRIAKTARATLLIILVFLALGMIALPNYARVF